LIAVAALTAIIGKRRKKIKADAWKFIYGYFQVIGVAFYQLEYLIF
jgi:hypothetical protein